MWKKIRRKLGRALFLEKSARLIQRIAKNEAELKRTPSDSGQGTNYRSALSQQITADRQSLADESAKRKRGWRGLIRAAWAWRAYRDLREQKFIKSTSSEQYIKARDALIRIDLLELGLKKEILSDREASELFVLRRQKKNFEKAVANYQKAVVLAAARKERKSISSKESSPHTSEQK